MVTREQEEAAGQTIRANARARIVQNTKRHLADRTELQARMHLVEYFRGCPGHVLLSVGDHAEMVALARDIVDEAERSRRGWLRWWSRKR